MMSRSSLPEPDRHTIMDQELAAAHGSTCVDLAAFAIDIDLGAALQPPMAAATRQALEQLCVSARLPSPEHAILSVR
jgi:hypothetical protein